MVKETKKISEVLGIYIPEINLGEIWSILYRKRCDDIEAIYMRSMIEHLEKV